MTAHPFDKRPAPLKDVSVCPVCGAMTVEVNCKIFCPKCHHVLENCNGD